MAYKLMRRTNLGHAISVLFGCHSQKDDEILEFGLAFACNAIPFDLTQHFTHSNLFNIAEMQRPQRLTQKKAQNKGTNEISRNFN